MIVSLQSANIHVTQKYLWNSTTNVMPSVSKNHIFYTVQQVHCITVYILQVHCIAVIHLMFRFVLFTFLPPYSDLQNVFGMYA